MGQFQTITVRHNMEVAHRLHLLEGKCENIHGHSMWVELTLHEAVDDNGILGGMDFGTVKSFFRRHLDTTYDHHLLLNKDDPFAQPLVWAGQSELERGALPGLVTFEGDPTTENLARWIGEWAEKEYGIARGAVTVHETSVNAASYEWWHA
jgi:6-pyruvoyltetrahydropterin/6-carboxytetrahydropterin synthase